MAKPFTRVLLRLSAACALLLTLALTPPATAQQPPRVLIEHAVQSLLDQFTRQREVYAADNRALFALVDRVAAPLFDLERIAKLVLARQWKQASAQQRAEFAVEFKKLLIGTYATALFQYTGKEAMTFTDAIISERKGWQFARLKSALSLSSGPPIAVEYALILGKDDHWKIYNITIAGLNMVTNYRNVYASAIDSLGLDGLIESMKRANAKNF